MAKVYVSSTFIDLQEHRAQVERVIRRMGHQDVAMEYYVAEDQRPVDKCLADVAACDLYIGIFAWRYGWIPKKNNRKKLSITEMEYRQAEKTAKPCLIFLLDGKAPWPPDFIDDDKTQIKRLRNELSEKHSTGPDFKSVDELGRLVAEAIHKWEKEHGYIPIATTIPEYNLDAYYQTLRKRYQTLALEGLTPPQKEEYLQIQLRSVFVEQNVRESPPPVELPKEIWEKLKRDKDIHPEDLPAGVTSNDVRRAREVYFEKPSHPVLDVLTDSRYKHTIVLGDPGSGKSTLARYIMLSLIEPTDTEKLRHKFDGYLPLLIELRTYVGLCLEKRCETPLEFFEHLGKTEGWALTKDALQNYLKNDGRAVVIFDGLDEIFEPEVRERITRQIVGFTNDYPKVRVIATSRIIGYARKILTDAGFTHFTLQDLDEKQVESFVSRWYDLAMSDRPDEAKERQERILKSFKESASIRQLAGNPMLLTIMAIIGKHQELPRERWKLYDHAASVLIQHWDVNKHLKDERIEADFIGEDDKKELLRRLAFCMQSGAGGLAGNYIHRDHLQSEFEGYLTERYSQPSDRAKVIAEAMIQQFRERNFILSLYGANLYGFVHRAFLEYFCASTFVYRFEKTKELTIDQLKTNVYGKHWEDQDWHEVLRLICGMIDEKWVGKIVEYLIDIYYPDPKQTAKRIAWNIVLASECLSEVRNISILFGSSSKLLKAICNLLDYYMVRPEASSQDSEFLTNRIINPLEVLGCAWAPIAPLISWLRQQYIKRRHARNIDFYAEPIAGFICSVACGSHNILSLMLDYSVSNNPASRIIALFVLAKCYAQSSKILELLCDRVVNDQIDAVRSAAIKVLVKYFHSETCTMRLLRDRAVNDPKQSVRSSAISALADHFKNDPQILPMLLERAIKDVDEPPSDESWHISVRWVVLRNLIFHFADDARLLPLLFERAINDVAPEVRKFAVTTLCERFTIHPDTLQLARDRAINDIHEDVRSDAVSALAEYYRDDAQTLPFLCERAVKDDNAYVRSAAVSALIEHYRDDAQTLPLLRDRSVNDESPKPDNEKEDWEEYVREVAINAIAKYWPDHPDSLPLLEDRAKNDPTPWLRKRAKELIKQLTEAKKKA